MFSCILPPLDGKTQGSAFPSAEYYFSNAWRARKVVTISRLTPQLSVSTSSITTKVVDGCLLSTRCSKSLVPSINSSFCAAVTPSLVTRIFTYGITVLQKVRMDYQVPAVEPPSTAITVPLVKVESVRYRMALTMSCVLPVLPLGDRVCRKALV